MGDFLPSGIAEGVVSSFGEYYECLDIKSPKSEENEENKDIIAGQYCLMKIILPFPSEESYREGEPVIQNTIDTQYQKEINIQFSNFVKSVNVGLNLIEGAFYRLGICIPSVCSAHEIETMINRSEFQIKDFLNFYKVFKYFDYIFFF
jgi:hypothetical protein